MNMKNRHGWADKTELRTPDGIDLSVNEMTEEQKAELKEIAKIRAELAVMKLRKDNEPSRPKGLLDYDPDSDGETA